MKCDYTLSDLNLPYTKWLPCGEPVKTMEYTEIRILTIENETFSYFLVIARDQSILLLFLTIFLSGNSFF